MTVEFQIRFFSVEQLVRKMINEKKMKKRQKFYVVVQIGAHKSETTLEEAYLDDDANTACVKFQQEVYVPIQWPTVISEVPWSSTNGLAKFLFQVVFLLYTKKGRSKTCIGKATVPMRKIYEPGETGYLPSFGPAFLNFFDSERVTRFTFFSKGNKAASEKGSKFIARLFLAMDCVEFMGESAAHCMHLDHAPIKEAERFMVRESCGSHDQ